MADFSGVTPDSPGVQSVPVLKPSTGRLPVAFGEHIKTGSTTRGGDDDLDSVVAEAKTDLDNKAESSAVDRIQTAVGDIILGEHVVPNWGLVNASGAEGGMAFANTWTLETAKAATYVAPSLQSPSGGAFYVARVPLGSDPRHYAMREPDDHFGDLDVPLNAITHLGSDANWDYYEQRVRFFGNITLRRSGHTVGVNTWGGKLGTAALAEAYALSYLGTWTDLAAGTEIAEGAVVEHPLAGGDAISVFYRSRTAHTKAANAPDLDTTNWTLVGPLYQGDWLDTWYHRTAMVADDGKLWLAVEHVVRGDPRPSTHGQTKWKSFGSSDDVDIDALRTEVERMIASFASHQEQVVSELPDPTAPESPGFAYLARKWEPTQGADGHQGELGYSVGEYEKTTGTANRAKVRMSKQSFAGQTIWGFAQRGARLVTVGNRAVPDLGECLHNPLGGAMPALYMVPFNLTAGTHEFWTCWVKTDLVLGQNPWDVPAPTAQNNVHRFLVRVYYKQGNSTLNFEIPMSIGAHGDTHRIIDGVSYTAMFSGENVQNQPGEGWIKGLDINDIDAATVEVEFYHSINSVRTGPLWLGGTAEGWTWRDPDEVPNTSARLLRVERASMVPGELLASITGTSGGANLDERPWTVQAGATGVTHENGGANTEGSWSKYLKLDCDHFAQSVADGSNGIIIESVRSGVILSTVFVPWSMFNTNWSADHEFFAGKTNTGKNNAATLYASCGVNNGDFHLRLAGGNATDALRVNIYRNN